MGDFAGLPPLIGNGIPQRPFSDTPAPSVPPVEAPLAGQALGGRSAAQNSGGQSRDKQDRDAQRLHSADFDDTTLPGPPPAFQVSLLELDQDLMLTLARINANHAMINAADAVAPVGANDDPAEPDGDVTEVAKSDASDPSDAEPAPQDQTMSRPPAEANEARSTE